MNTSRTKRTVEKLSNQQYREAFVAEHIGSGVAFQIHALREKLGLSQAELAKLAGMHQSQISKVENPDDEEGVSVATLQRIAAAFDVALVVRFVSFGDLVEWEANLSDAALAPPPFSEDPKLAATQTAPAVATREAATRIIYLQTEHRSAAATRPLRKRANVRLVSKRDTTALSELWLR
ncbi:MAG: helix-turn-helix transcriptional regulator [Thermoanaerobaculia bacterium]